MISEERRKEALLWAKEWAESDSDVMSGMRGLGATFVEEFRARDRAQTALSIAKKYIQRVSDGTRPGGFDEASYVLKEIEKAEGVKR